MEPLDRITQDPGIMGGKPCIRRMRVTVGMIVGQLGSGQSIDRSLPTTPTLSAKTSCRRSATPLGALKSVRSRWLPHEAPPRYEPVTSLG